jgi:hypothetical protein
MIVTSMIGVGTCFSPPVIYYALFRSRYKYLVDRFMIVGTHILYVNPLKLAFRGQRREIHMKHLKSYFTWFDWTAWLCAPSAMKSTIKGAICNIHSSGIKHGMLWNPYRMRLYTHNWNMIRGMMIEDGSDTYFKSSNPVADPVMEKYKPAAPEPAVASYSEVRKTARSNGMILITRIDLSKKYDCGTMITSNTQRPGVGPSQGSWFTTNLSRWGENLGSDWWEVDMSPDAEVIVGDDFMWTSSYLLKRNLFQGMNFRKYEELDLAQLE